jgi:response regulator RpfG family c-di-GMP phosphodiesterase
MPALRITDISTLPGTELQQAITSVPHEQGKGLLFQHRLADDTGAHVERTQTFCRVLAKTLRTHSCYADRIDQTFVANIYYAASLHDIGKVGIPDCILLKHGKHTPEEFAIMKTHAIIGAKALQNACGNFHITPFSTWES